MTKLTDTQTILLSAASQRDSGSLYPWPSSITTPVPAIAKSVASLLRQDFVEERRVNEVAVSWRTEDDQRFGIFITEAGLAAIGLSPAGAESTQIESQPTEPEPRRETKSTLVLDLLRREQGATLDELVGATGWLPHTTRAALTGLRKKGHEIAKLKRDGATCYRIEAAA